VNHLAEEGGDIRSPHTVRTLGSEPSPVNQLLEVCGLAATIGSREVLSDVNLAADDGELLSVVGETGSGKTLTCRAIVGLLPRLGGQVTAGRILLRGQDLTPLSEREWHRLRGRRIAFVPQSSLLGLDPVMTIGRQLTETVQVLDQISTPAARALELLEMVEMPRAREVVKSYPHQLSGGMRQRVMIALALAGNPELLLADEPTTALDVTVQRTILELLDRLRREANLTVLMVTHDLDVVEAVSDSVAVMYAGMTVELGPVADVLQSPQHPYTRALLAARPSSRKEGERLATISGLPPAPEEWPTGCRFAPRCRYVDDRCVAEVPSLTHLPGHHAAACIRQDELPDA
jgi:oligopeptide/dipeptide ABC transporter ATP-binding protein